MQLHDYGINVFRLCANHMTDLEALFTLYIKTSIQLPPGE